MTWDIDSLRRVDDLLEQIVPERVLDELEGPMLFTLRSSHGRLLLAYLSDQVDDATRYVLVPTSESRVEDIDEGRVTLREALDQPLAWIADTVWEKGDDGVYIERVTSVWEGGIDDVPDECLPVPGTMLHLEHEPDVVLRVVGIKMDDITLGLLQKVSGNIRRAVRILADFVRNNMESQGRRPSVSTLSTLHFRKVAFGSLELHIDFSKAKQGELPFEPGDADPLEAVKGLLEKGCSWANNDNDDEQLPGRNKDEQEAIAKALATLAPSPRSRFDGIELRGNALHTDTPLVLNKRLRERLDKRKTIEVERKTIIEMGRVGIVDFPGLTFTFLAEDGRTLTCKFDEEDSQFWADAGVQQTLLDIVGKQTGSSPIEIIVFSVIGPELSWDNY